VALGADLDDDGRLKRALAGIAAYVEGTGERVVDNSQ